jgi:hypothetical protein
MSAIKSAKLGMNFGSARSRLDRDLLFKLAVEAGYTCFRCGRHLDRESFSVDHKKHWSTAEDPKAAFFDLDNVAFSHLHCNSGNTSRKREHSYAQGCRCPECRSEKQGQRSTYDANKRHDRYVKYGT